MVGLRYAELVYNGQWFTPLRTALDAFVQQTEQNLTGSVRLKLYKGNVILAGRKSAHSLYREDYVTFDANRRIIRLTPRASFAFSACRSRSCNACQDRGKGVSEYETPDFGLQARPAPCRQTRRRPHRPAGPGTCRRRRPPAHRRQPGTFTNLLRTCLPPSCPASAVAPRLRRRYRLRGGGGEVVLGFVSATTGMPAGFLELGARHAGKLLLPLLARYMRARPDRAQRADVDLPAAGASRTHHTAEHSSAELLDHGRNRAAWAGHRRPAVGRCWQSARADIAHWT